MTVEAIGEPVGDDAGADHQSALSQRHHPVGLSSRQRAGEAVGADHRQGRHQGEDGRPVDICCSRDAENRPGEEQRRDHQARRVGEAARPGVELRDAVEAADEGEQDPADNHGSGHDHRRPQRDGEDQRDDRAADGGGGDIGAEQEPVQERGSIPRAGSILTRCGSLVRD